MSPVYYQDPANYYAQENQRRDEQMRNLLNMVMAAKRFQYERGQDEWQRGVTERQLAETARYHDMYADRYGESRATPAAVPSSIQEAQALVDSGLAKSMGEAVLMLKQGTRGETPEDFETKEKIRAKYGKEGAKPSDYDKKVARAEQLFKDKKITEQEYNRIVTGYSESVTPRQDASLRAGIDLRTKAARSGLTSKYPKINKKTIGGIKQTENLNPDFPVEYDLSRQRVLGNVGDDADADTVKRYDDMFLFYQELVKRGINKATFMGMEPPAGIDKNTIAYWFDFYK